MDADMNRIRSALFYLSPDMPRAEWVEIGMALKAGLGEQEFNLFDEWSRQSDKYNARDIRDTWRSIKPDGGITIATLYFRAREAGWHYNGERPTREEVEAGKRETAKRAERQKAEEARKHAKAREKAAAIWEAARLATGNPYLALKRVPSVATLREIPADEARKILGYDPKSRDEPLTGRLLVVPISVAGKFSSVELIDGDGRKHVLAGSKKKDGFWAAQPLPDGDGTGVTVTVGEGVATCLSVREATGHLAVAALCSSNLRLVALAMRARFPLARLLILADLGGERDAEEAAQEASATLVLPDFGPDRPMGKKDFNDLAQHRGLEAVAECIRQQAPTTTAAEVLKIFRKWLYLPDPGVVYVPLAAIAANLMKGDPVWVMVVGPSSGGKTEIIIAIVRLPYVRLGATLTEAALLSGTPKKQMAAGSKGGLLRDVGKFGILALKDFTSILSMHRDRRAEVLAALREVFDGAYVRDLGTDGGRRLEWKGKLGLIAGCTAAIDSHHAVMSVMGERFLLYRLPVTNQIEQAKQALANTGRVHAMREELAAAVEGLFSGLDIQQEMPSIDDSEIERLAALSSLVASARSAVERDPYKREIDLVLDTELPARLVQTLRRLYAGMLAIGLDQETAWPLVVKTGLDCIPKLRRAVFEVLLATEDWLTTAQIATKIQHPPITAKRSLEDLGAHGVVDRRPPKKGVGDGKSHSWRLSDVARDRMEAIRSEMSPPPQRDAPTPSSSSSSSSSINDFHIYTEEDFPDRMPETEAETQAECGFQGGSDDAEALVAEAPDRHCWSCKGEVADADRCPSCGWITCSCGACSPECAGASPHAEVGPLYERVVITLGAGTKEHRSFESGEAPGGMTLAAWEAKARAAHGDGATVRPVPGNGGGPSTNLVPAATPR